jgi:hypothetical protein
MRSKTLPIEACVALLLLCATNASLAADVPQNPASPSVAAPTADPVTGVVFARPDRIRYDDRSFIIDGKPTFIYSGSIHYFRCPQPLWKDRLQKLKDAGLNCVETYLAWNYHEPKEPADVGDFSKLERMQEITDFITLARELGLYVIIRPGPYICAEWDRGGFPGWLLKHRSADTPPGYYLRGNVPQMLAWDRHWLAACAEVVRPHLVTNLPAGTPGVIMWQIENEYDHLKLDSQVRADVLHSLAHDSLDLGIDVPLITCWTMDPLFRADPLLRQSVLETTNCYPNFDMNKLVGALARTTKYQPEKLKGMSELQGGWFAKVGGQLSHEQGHNAAQINQITLIALEQGVTSMNYYMLYGGSNFGYGAARNMIQSYDYNAPIREWGGLGDRYYAVKALGQMLAEHGPKLARAEAVELTPTANDHTDVSVSLRRAEDGSRYYFVRTPQNEGPRKGSLAVELKGQPQPRLKIDYDLPALGAKIFYLPPDATDASQGQWLPKPVAFTSNTPAVMPVVPVEIISTRPDAATTWRVVGAGQMLPDLDVFDQRYVIYRATFTLADADLQTRPVLSIHSRGGSDTLVVRINGKEERVTVPEKGPATLPLAGLAQAGQNTAEILFENFGAVNSNVGIDESQGITGVGLVLADADSAAAAKNSEKKENTEKRIERLEVCGQTAGQAQHWESADAATDWQTYDPKTSPGKTLTWYRLSFAMPSSEQGTGWHLHLDADANAFVYLNGHLLGRYYAQGPQRDVWLPECWLRRGMGEKNTIALQARPTGDGPVIKAVDVRQSGN